ncbi:28S ribosomal protein S17, mitochondrial-like [Paramacrobiotus metropolitanus]|uniref:28S ribosomal protein S17, mitochondrial-like n=1 Tax=Paramacrobiotus metropolitanus TaxID=2943436 RepID=UPI0024460889|nr:28S ribosomal protein S17, mitochondrial-like [Paramacrobiotus metropolitanus]
MSLARKFMVIGKVVEKLSPKISLVEVQTNELDPYLRMYFGRYKEYRTDDGPHYTKIGDYVMIKDKINPQRVDLVYEVSEVIHRCGQLMDPITKKRVVTDKERVDFLEDLRHINQLLPDYTEQTGLRYSDNDVVHGTPQPPSDKTSFHS